MSNYTRGTNSRALAAALVLVLLCPLARSPAAAAPPDEARLRAKGHYAEGKRLYNLGKFDEAARFFQKAYEAKPQAVFLYNLAQCFKHLDTPKDLKKAIFYFKGYLRGTPSAADLAEVKQTITKLEERIAALEAERKREPKQAPPKPAPVKKRDLARPFYKTWWFWTVVGAVVAGAGVGIGFGVAESGGGRVAGGEEHNWDRWTP